MKYPRLSLMTLFIVVALAVGLLTPGGDWNSSHRAQAATLIVNSNADNATTCAVSGTVCLRNAIASAASGDTLTFASNVTGAITLSQGPLTIAGPGASTLAIDGNNAVTVFTINSGTAVTVSGLTVRNGEGGTGGGVANSTLSNNYSPGGGGVYNSGTLTVTNSTFFGNHTSGTFSGVGDGGGIFNTSVGTLTVTNSTFSGNYTGNVLNLVASGGGIANEGTLHLGSTIVAGNTASSGVGFEISGMVTSQGNNLLGIIYGSSGYVRQRPTQRQPTP